MSPSIESSTDVPPNRPSPGDPQPCDDSLPFPENEIPKTFSQRPPPAISLVGAAAFKRLIAHGEEVFSLHFEPLTPDSPATLRAMKHQPAPTSSLRTEALPTDEGEMLATVVPPEYHDFFDVFSREEAKAMPPHRDYDHTIEIEDDKPLPHGPIYPCSGKELEALREFLDDMLGKGFIRSSSSPGGAPVLFAKKKDGTLRLCVDYRSLNRITRKNRYPIPLISNLIDQLKGAKIYTKFDLRSGYYNVRIARDQEWKTAFRTRYGSFEFLVMPLGLTNAPATFQHFMNDIFRDMTDVFVIVYLDDILVFSDNEEDHRKHVRLVLERLRKYNLHVKPEKTLFNTRSIEFLGFIVSPDGVSMDPAKVHAILIWPTPGHLKDVQSFLGFANFYRRFIECFSDMATPLTRLTRKDTPFAWGDAQQAAFDEIKVAFTKAPILIHFDPENATVVESDASDYAIACIISQISPIDGDIHPIAFYSRGMTPAELNYEIYDKELLAIFEAFRQWRSYLEGATHVVLVLSDHKNLEYFATTKQLTRRQVRWSEYLSGFDYIIRYRAGRLGTKPDALTRRGDVYPKGGDGAYALANPHNFQSMFKAGQLLRAIVLDTAALTISIRDGLATDDVAQTHIRRLRSSVAPPEGDPWSLSRDGEYLLFKGKIYVPDHRDVRLDVLRSLHDHPLAGHPGITKTIHNIRRQFYWPRLVVFVTDYVNSCARCRAAKSVHHKPYGPLRFLPIGERPWDSISMDFIEGLPMSEGCDMILVVVDRLTKMALLIPTHREVDAEDVAKIFLRHVFSKHGTPSDIVSDRGKHFISRFWRSLCTMLGIKANLSTAYHPETDGQTERLNQILEAYLRIFINYIQDDWVSHLPLAEFAYNNTSHSATQVTPFFANKGLHPKLEISLESVPSEVAYQAASDMQELHDYLRDQIRITIGQYQAATANRRLPIPDYPIGERVWLDAKNIRTMRPSKKLDHRRLGPYEVIEKISSHAYRLGLPLGLRRIHNVFHTNLLEPEKRSAIPNRVVDPPPPVEIDDADEYEVARILDVRLDRRRRPHNLRYLVEWKGYEDTADATSWEPVENVANATELIAEFHARYPDKPHP
jgi:RNase H-like domain found in reverse transcriptase/Reverse transcriptase (RNA-dependent DNA polymerase)/Integrase zinc binding domain/Integrase core domain/Chromo (CHRromatin Organisation MOdifier) domain